VTDRSQPLSREAEQGYLPLTIIIEGTVMSSPAGCLSRHALEPVGHPAGPQTQPDPKVTTSPGVNDRFALLRRAAEIMATGALTEEQAKALSRQIRESLQAPVNAQGSSVVSVVPEVRRS